MKRTGFILLVLLGSLSMQAQNTYKPLPKVKGIIFRVQLKLEKKLLEPSTFKGLHGVMLDRTKRGTYKYIVGSFQYYESANAMKVEMVESGYKDANVIAFHDGNRILIEDAMEMVAASFVDERPVPTPEPAKKEEEEISAKSTGKLTFTVQVAARKGKAPSDHPRFKKTPELREEKSEDGLYHYYSGMFNNMSAARDRRLAMKDLGFEYAFIVSYLDGERIPLRDAVRILMERDR